MYTFYVEKTLKNDGTESVVLVNEKYEIIEPVALFLDYLEKKGRSPNTIENYCRDLKEYFTWLSIEKIEFYEVNKRMLIGWIDYINTEIGTLDQKSARTVNRYIATIASFYNFFENIGGYLEENPFKIDYENSNINYKLKKTTNKNVNFNFYRRKEKKKKNNSRLFRNQIELLFDGISNLYENNEINERNKLIFRILYETGCRIGEVLGLRIIDYSTPNPNDKIGIIYVREHVPLYHKDHSIKTNEREIPVSMDLIYEIDNYVTNIRPYKDGVETIFVNHSYSTMGNYMTRSAIEKIFIRLSKKVGIKCTPHMLRHTHGTELRENGYNQIYILNRLGHNSIESTNKYMHISYEAQAEAYEKFLERRNGGAL